MAVIRPIPHDPMLPPYTDKCRCMECGEYFNSSGIFTKHRVGFACLSIEQMSDKGWCKSSTGHWVKPFAIRDRQRLRAAISSDPIPE